MECATQIAQTVTSIATACTLFALICNAQLGRFSIDRLMSILNRLGPRIEVRARLRRVEAA